jgi:hypothetical protein
MSSLPADRRDEAILGSKFRLNTLYTEVNNQQKRI